MVTDIVIWYNEIQRFHFSNLSKMRTLKYLEGHLGCTLLVIWLPLESIFKGSCQHRHHHHHHCHHHHHPHYHHHHHHHRHRHRHPHPHHHHHHHLLHRNLTVHKCQPDDFVGQTWTSEVRFSQNHLYDCLLTTTVHSPFEIETRR